MGIFFWVSMLGILYSFRRCPYAMRARLALASCVKEGSLELREVVLRDKPQAMLAISPKGTVPVLQLSDGRVLDESLDIMNFALTQNINHQTQLYPAYLHTQIDAFIEENDGDFKWALDRYKYADRYEESEEYYRAKGEKFLAKLEEKLNSHRFLFADDLTLGDLAIFPFVRQFAHVNKAWFAASAYIKLNDWLDDLLESDLFKRVMSKYPQWTEGRDRVVFP